jgi:hypothetical protein
VSRKIIAILAFVVIGAIINALIAVGAAQFSFRPVASMTEAKQLAMRKIMLEANPTPPIWPTFREENWGVTVHSTYPDDLKLQRTTGPYIIVHVECGWPWRCLKARSEYMPGGWRDVQKAVALPARIGPRGRRVKPELPIAIRWPQFAANSMVFAMAVAVPIVVIKHAQAAHRKRGNRCEACGYPRGKSEVCTECGATLSRRPTESALH